MQKCESYVNICKTFYSVENVFNATFTAFE